MTAGISLLIMAGGRATRFDFEKAKTQIREKALLSLGSKYFIEYIIDAARSAKNLDRIYVAVSPFTPKTREFLLTATKSVVICDTPGRGYHEDLIYVVKQFKLGVVLTIGADIPLIKNSQLNQIMNNYRICKKAALAVMSPYTTFKKLGLTATSVIASPDYREGLVPLGINIIDGNLIDQPELEQAIYVIEDNTLLFNINTIVDYQILLSRYGGNVQS